VGHVLDLAPALRRGDTVAAIWPDDEAWDGAVFLLETSEEAPPPDTVKHWLRNYAALGVLNRIVALLIARPMGYSQQQTLQLWAHVRAVRAVRAEAGRAGPRRPGVQDDHRGRRGRLPPGQRFL